MAYVHGNVKRALTICQEVIKKGNLFSFTYNINVLFIELVPNAAEPYLTIAQIYEDQNDHDKVFEVSEIIFKTKSQIDIIS